MKKKLLTLGLFLTLSPLARAQWSTSGTNVTYSGGNVGIGTVNPAFTLDVNGVIGTNQYFTSKGGVYTSLTSNGINSAAGAAYLSFRSNNIDNRMVIDPNGNIGIGTTAPGAKLEIVGNGSGTSLFLDNNQFSVNRNPLTGGVVDATKGSAVIVLAPNSNGGNMQFHTSSTTGGGCIRKNAYNRSRLCRYRYDRYKRIYACRKRQRCCNIHDHSIKFGLARLCV